MRLIVLWLALLAALAGAPAAAQPQFPPRPMSPVYDAAGIIPDAQEIALDSKLRDYNRRTGRALVVATVPSLQDDTIEDYAVRLYQAWGIGSAETDAGLLLLVAPTERKVRIEVGYGLHQYVTDILSGRIIRDRITPRFKAGDYPGGIDAGIDALITQLDREPADAKAVAEAAAAADRERQDQGFPLGTVIWLGFLFFFFILPMLSRGRGGRRYRGGGVGSTVGNVILWSALNSAMNSGRSGGGGGWGGGGGGGGFGGFGGGMSGGGGASGSW